MRLRKPCQHDRYEAHEQYVTYPKPPGEWTAEAWRATWGYEHCDGGEFLADGSIVVEKVGGEWPQWFQDDMRRGLGLEPDWFAETLAERVINVSP